MHPHRAFDRAVPHGALREGRDQSAEHFGPYPHGDRFAVRFVYDITNKPSGKRMTMDEVGLFTVENDKIVREELFYQTG